MTIGLMHGVNRINAYSNAWPNLYNSESKKIRKVCGGILLSVEHIGSTSIVGLKAKPIIDIAVGVQTLGDSEKMIPGMQSIGYDYPGDVGIPDDRIFGRDPGLRLYLVHVVEYKSERWNRYIKFRNALRSDSTLATKYVELKSEIAEKHPVGRGVYTELKAEFINRVLEDQR